MVLVGGLAIVYGGYDGAHTLDEHHSLFCAPFALEAQGDRSALDAGSALGRANGVQVAARQQERWAAERPLSENDLPLGDRERAAKSPLPLAMAKALHRHAVQMAPPRDTYIDPDSGYSVFTQAYLKRRPCCGNGCRHCPWGHVNVPGRKKATLNEELEW